MNRSKLQQILNKAVKYRKQDIERDNIAEAFFNAYAPTSHTPYIDNNLLDGFLQAINIIDPNLSDDLSRFIYDREMGANPGEVFSIEQENIVIDSTESMLKYLIDIYTK